MYFIFKTNYFQNISLNSFLIRIKIVTFKRKINTSRGGTTLCTRHAYSKYIIDNRMFTIQFENGFWSENISLKKILKLNVKYCWQYLYTSIAIIHFKRSHIENKFRQLDKFTFNLSIFFNEMFSLPVGIDLGQLPKNALHSWCFFL
jgi:hypothetical protein